MKRTILILLILFSSCLESPKVDKKVEEKVLGTNFGLAHSGFTIIQFNPELYWIFQNSKPSTTNLSMEELGNIEPILEKAILEHNKGLEKNSVFRLALESYKRQYVPILNENGEKVVWVNFLCKDFEFEKWRTEVPVVADGGNCFFNLKINLSRKYYSDLRINGIA